MNDTLVQRLQALTDVDLIRLLTLDADQYRQEALDIARAEAARRNLTVDAALLPTDPAAPDLLDSLRSSLGDIRRRQEPGRFTAADRPITCHHCDSDVFEDRTALLNTRVLTFFRLDWLNRDATVLVCAQCGLLQWFAKAPVRVSE